MGQQSESKGILSLLESLGLTEEELAGWMEPAPGSEGLTVLPGEGIAMGIGDADIKPGQETGGIDVPIGTIMDAQITPGQETGVTPPDVAVDMGMAEIVPGQETGIVPPDVEVDMGMAQIVPGQETGNIPPLPIEIGQAYFKPNENMGDVAVYPKRGTGPQPVYPKMKGGR